MAVSPSKRLVTEANLPELVQDIVGAFVKSGTNISVYYDDANNSLTISEAAGRVNGSGISNIVKLTQAQYDALSTKDGSTLYVVSG